MAERDPIQHTTISLAILLTLVASGMIGYALIEGWGPLDALYMTVITLGTVGFQEVHTLSQGGKIFTILLIVSGVSVLGYLVGSLAQIMFEGQFQRIIGRRRVEKKIMALEGHYIICGFGRMGGLICRELAAKPIPFVVIEKHPESHEKLHQEEYLHIRGDATEDDTLIRAGIKKAKGLVSVVSSDTENVYITLTARGLNPDIYILARAGEEGSEIKLLRAGANKVISPYLIGGSRMAQAILRPNVVDFIEIATGREHLELQMEELTIPETSPYIGETLASSGFRKETGVIIVGIKKRSGKMVFNPDSHTRLEAHDTLILLGNPEAIVKMETLLAPGNITPILRHTKGTTSR
ncbi:MAG: potassium channel protein [Desulfuromonadia bacterium]